MKHARTRLHTLLLSAIVVLGFSLTAIIALVYLQVSRELRSQGSELVRTRVSGVQQALVGQLEQISLSSRAVLRVLSSRSRVAVDVEPQITYLIQSHAHIRRVWIDLDGSQIAAPIPLPTRTIDRTLGTAVAPGAPLPVQRLHDAGGWYIGPAYRDTIELSTHVPVVAFDVSSIDRRSTILVIVDLSEVFFAMLPDLVLLVDGARVPIVVSLCDSDGFLLETSRNFPIVSIEPLDDDSRIDLQSAMSGESATRVRALERVAVPDRSIVAVLHDPRSGMFVVGSVPERPILSRVNRLSGQVLLIGGICVAMILILGMVLVRTVDRLAVAEGERATMRIRSIQATMNPHFLFNTLDTMVGLTERRDYDALLSMIRSLSRQLRSVVREPEEFVSLGAEVEALESYMEIQRYRYPGRFSLDVDVSDECLSMVIPRFSLQPLVENCFTHALPHHDGELSIRVHCHALRDELSIAVADDGPGCSEERWSEIESSLAESRNIETHGIGLYSVHARAVAVFGAPYGLRREPTDRGFAIRLLIPVRM